MTRALLFAFRPILVDDEALRQRLVERVLAEEGIELPSAGLSGARAVADELEALRAAVARTGREPSAEWLSRLTARLAVYRRDSLAHEGGALVAGVGDLLRELEAAGLVLGIVTGARRGEVTPVLATRRRWAIGSPSW